MNTIESRIQFWLEQSKLHQKWFSQVPIKTFVDVAILFKEGNQEVNDEILLDFIDGLALLPFALEDKNDSEKTRKVNELTEPFIEFLKKYVQSDRYRQSLLNKYVEGDEEFQLGKIKVPITVFKLLQFIRDKNKLPLTGTDVEILKADYVEYRNSISSPAPIPSKEKRAPQLSISQIALKYVYEGKRITRKNGDEIAESYGYKSGEKLFQKFTYYSSKANRTGLPTLCTPKKLKNKIILYESVVDLLDDENQTKVLEELKELKNMYEAEYQ